MAGPNYVLDKGYKSGAAIRQFRAVALNANEVVTEAGAAAANLWGICQEEITADDAAEGRIADIRLLGASRAIAGAALGIGTWVTSDTQGRMVAAGAGQLAIGRLMQATSAVGDHVDVLINPTIMGA
jgi:hypothetical protein